MCNAWMKHAMTSSWVIAPAPVACMTCLSGNLFVRKSQPFSPSWNCPTATHTLSLTQGHTTTNQLCWFCDTKWNFNRLHTRPHACSHWISTASADRATNRPSWEPKFVAVTTELHYRQATAGCWESWDTHSRWWYRETIAVCPECSEAATKIHQKVVNNDINLNRSIAKAAQNKTPSAGLVCVPKACRHLFLP